MAGPLTNAVNQRFDAWDAEIDNLKTKNKEYAQKKAKELTEQVKDYTEKQLEALKPKGPGASLPKTEITKPTKIEDALEAVKACVDAVNAMIKWTVEQAADITTATAAIPKRSEQTLAKLTEI